jgi:hypothetical protein
MKTPDEKREYMRQYMANRRKNPAITEYNRAASRRWRASNPEASRAASQAWRIKHPEKVKAHNAAWRAARTPEELSEHHRQCYRRTRRDSHLKKKFGLTAEKYNAMLALQSGHCALCPRPDLPDKRLAVDHDHETGRVRALLCDRCNRGIGLLDEEPARLRAAADYIDKHNLTRDELLA